MLRVPTSGFEPAHGSSCARQGLKRGLELFAIPFVCCFYLTASRASFESESTQHLCYQPRSSFSFCAIIFSLSRASTRLSKYGPSLLSLISLSSLSRSVGHSPFFFCPPNVTSILVVQNPFNQPFFSFHGSRCTNTLLLCRLYP
jgi:hypothetical protein